MINARFNRARQMPNDDDERGIKAPSPPIVPASNMRLKRPGPQAIPQNRPQTQAPQLQPGAVQNLQNNGQQQNNNQMLQNQSIGHSGAPIGQISTNNNLGETVGRIDPNAPLNIPNYNKPLTGRIQEHKNPGDVERPTTPTEVMAGGPTNDQLAQEAIAELLGGGPRSTADEEALIRELLEGTVGQGQADLNARMAAGGFGSSGALGAMSGDMRRQAAQAASGQILDVRQGARDEWLEQVMAGLDGEFGDRKLDMDEEQYKAYIDVLKEVFADQGFEDEGSSDNPASDFVGGEDSPLDAGVISIADDIGSGRNIDWMDALTPDELARWLGWDYNP